MTDSNITLSKSIKDSSTLLRSSKIPTNHTHLQHSNTRLTSSTSPPPTNSSSSSNSRTSNTSNTSSISLIPSSRSSSSSSMVSSRHCGHHLASNNSNGH